MAFFKNCTVFTKMLRYHNAPLILEISKRKIKVTIIITPYCYACKLCHKYDRMKLAIMNKGTVIMYKAIKGAYFLVLHTIDRAWLYQENQDGTVFL